MGEVHLRLPDTVHAYGAVLTVQNAVEAILHDSFGEVGGFEDLQGRLSTNPSTVHAGIDADAVYDKCLSFSQELALPLRRFGYQATVSRSATYENEPFNHVYVVVQIDGVEVLVDPTIGQFLEGHNNVFVGVRETLRDLVVHHTGSDKEYRAPAYFDSFLNEEFFTIVWGDSSEPFRFERGVGDDPRIDSRAKANIGDRLKLYQ